MVEAPACARMNYGNSTSVGCFAPELKLTLLSGLNECSRWNQVEQNLDVRAKIQLTEKIGSSLSQSQREIVHRDALAFRFFHSSAGQLILLNVPRTEVPTGTERLSLRLVSENNNKIGRIDDA